MYPYFKRLRIHILSQNVDEKRSGGYRIQKEDDAKMILRTPLFTPPYWEQARYSGINDAKTKLVNDPKGVSNPVVQDHPF